MTEDNWVPESPQAFSAQASHSNISLELLGLKVPGVLDINDIDSARLHSKVVILSVVSQKAESFNSTLREQLYRLCDSELRPFCQKTHRPFPIRERRSENSRKVSNAIVDSGTVFVTLNDRSGSAQILDSVLHSLLKQNPALILVVSDSSSLVEAVYSSHATFAPKEVLPLIMLSSRMELSPSSSDDHVAHGKNLIRALNKNLVGGRAMLQLGIQRELNAQRDYEVALASHIWVVEYLYLLGMWRNALNGREVSPLEHVFDHLDKLGPLGWQKSLTGLHLAFDLNVLSRQSFGFADGTKSSSVYGSRAFGCNLQDLGPVLTYLGRTGLCKVAHIMADLSEGDSTHQSEQNDSKGRSAAEVIAALIYKFVLLREEYSEG